LFFNCIVPDWLAFGASFTYFTYFASFGCSFTAFCCYFCGESEELFEAGRGDGECAGVLELTDQGTPIFSSLALAMAIPKPLMASSTFSPVLALTFSEA
jgi:hypothetical protein